MYWPCRPNGVEFLPFSAVTVVGDDIVVWHDEPSAASLASNKRNEQVFGKGTIAQLKKSLPPLSVALVPAVLWLSSLRGWASAASFSSIRCC